MRLCVLFADPESPVASAVRRALDESFVIEPASLQESLAEKDVERALSADLVLVEMDGPAAAYLLGLLHALHGRVVGIAADGTGHLLGDTVPILDVADIEGVNGGDLFDATVPFAQLTERFLRQRNTTSPLAGVIDPAAIPEPVRRFLDRHGILEESDLPRLQFEALAAAPGVERPALQRFVRELARSGRFHDEKRLQEFIVSRGIFI